MTNNEAFATTLICVLAVRMADKIPADNEQAVIELVEGIVQILEVKGYLT